MGMEQRLIRSYFVGMGDYRTIRIASITGISRAARERAPSVRLTVSDVQEGTYFAERVITAARMSELTESPIETMFGMSMMDLIEDSWALLPQFKWRGYRVDWALERPEKSLIFIECDGSEFHTRPDQIAKDKVRDIHIRRAGIKLFRFTGSEIYRNAEGCALRVYLEARKT
jgi:very-short-patch-repair endonuclease